jgi:hypothetical protein
VMDATQFRIVLVWKKTHSLIFVNVQHFLQLTHRHSDYVSAILNLCFKI